MDRKELYKRGNILLTWSISGGEKGVNNMRSNRCRIEDFWMLAVAFLSDFSGELYIFFGHFGCERAEGTRIVRLKVYSRRVAILGHGDGNQLSTLGPLRSRRFGRFEGFLAAVYHVTTKKMS